MSGYERRRAELLAAPGASGNPWRRWRIGPGPIDDEELSAWRRGERRRHLRVSTAPGSPPPSLIAALDLPLLPVTPAHGGPGASLRLEGHALVLDEHGVSRRFDFTFASITPEVRATPVGVGRELWLELRASDDHTWLRLSDFVASDRQVLVSVLVDAFGADAVFPPAGAVPVEHGDAATGRPELAAWRRWGVSAPMSGPELDAARQSSVSLGHLRTWRVVFALALGLGVVLAVAALDALPDDPRVLGVFGAIGAVAVGVLSTTPVRIDGDRWSIGRWPRRSSGRLDTLRVPTTRTLGRFSGPRLVLRLDGDHGEVQLRASRFSQADRRRLLSDLVDRHGHDAVLGTIEEARAEASRDRTFVELFLGR